MSLTLNPFEQGPPSGWLTETMTAILAEPAPATRLTRSLDLPALWVDTSDGQPCSDQDCRCDKCAVVAESLTLRVVPVFIDASAYARASQMEDVEREADVMVTLGLCPTCATSEGWQDPMGTHHPMGGSTRATT